MRSIRRGNSVKDFLVKLWKETAIKVLAGILATIVLAGLALLVPITRGLAWKIVRALAEPVELPLWRVLLLVTLGIAAAIHVLRSFSQPTYVRKYVKDEIDGILWRWGYKDGAVTDLRPFCAKGGCDVELMLEEKGNGAEVGRILEYYGTGVSCTGCNTSFVIRNAFNLPDHVRRKIEKKIRDGSWKNRGKHLQ